MSLVVNSELIKLVHQELFQKLNQRNNRLEVNTTVNLRLNLQEPDLKKQVT